MSVKWRGLLAVLVAAGFAAVLASYTAAGQGEEAGSSGLVWVAGGGGDVFLGLNVKALEYYDTCYFSLSPPEECGEEWALGVLPLVEYDPVHGVAVLHFAGARVVPGEKGVGVVNVTPVKPVLGAFCRLDAGGDTGWALGRARELVGWVEELAASPPGAGWGGVEEYLPPYVSDVLAFRERYGVYCMPNYTVDVPGEPGGGSSVVWPLSVGRRGRYGVYAEDTLLSWLHALGLAGGGEERVVYVHNVGVPGFWRLYTYTGTGADAPSFIKRYHAWFQAWGELWAVYWHEEGGEKTVGLKDVGSGELYSAPVPVGDMDMSYLLPLIGEDGGYGFVLGAENTYYEVWGGKVARVMAIRSLRRGDVVSAESVVAGAAERCFGGRVRLYEYYYLGRGEFLAKLRSGGLYSLVLVGENGSCRLLLGSRDRVLAKGSHVPLLYDRARGRLVVLGDKLYVFDLASGNYSSTSIPGVTGRLFFDKVSYGLVVSPMLLDVDGDGSREVLAELAYGPTGSVWGNSPSIVGLLVYDPEGLPEGFTLRDGAVLGGNLSAVPACSRVGPDLYRWVFYRVWSMLAGRPLEDRLAVLSALVNGTGVAPSLASMLKLWAIAYTGAEGVAGREAIDWGLRAAAVLGAYAAAAGASPDWFWPRSSYDLVTVEGLVSWAAARSLEGQQASSLLLGLDAGGLASLLSGPLSWTGSPYAWMLEKYRRLSDVWWRDVREQVVECMERVRRERSGALGGGEQATATATTRPAAGGEERTTATTVPAHSSPPAATTAGGGGASVTGAGTRTPGTTAAQATVQGGGGSPSRGGSSSQYAAVLGIVAVAAAAAVVAARRRRG